MGAQRQRLSRLLALLAVGLLGLASRHFSALLPSLLKKNSGDALWALAVFVLLGLIWPGLSIPHAALAATVISFLDEFSQIYQAPWIIVVRSNPLGHLILGSGFNWTDLICYVVGIAVGIALDHVLPWRIAKAPVDEAPGK